LLVMEVKYDWNWIDHPQQATYMTWVSFVDFEPRIKNQAQVEALITHNSRTLYLMESCLIIDGQILIRILWASTCYIGCEYLWHISIWLFYCCHDLDIEWKSQVLKWIKCYVRNSNT
jgi:hypothetical protein